MKLSLVCKPHMRNVVLELLASRNIGIEEQSNVCAVESGCEIPKGKIAIVFDLENLGPLMEFLDKLARVTDDYPNTIVGKTKDESFQIINYAKVYYFEARGNNVFCIAEGFVKHAPHEYRLKEKLYELESRLPSGSFIRVGKSHIVNIHNIDEIIPWFGRRLILRFVDGKKEIEVSRNYVKNLKEFLGM